MKKEYKNWIGKNIHIVIDRKIGSSHPDYPETKYELNYGYIPNTVAGDGEPIDAYVIGDDNPLDEFEGIVIAIVERKNDDEFKLVVADTDKYGKEDIMDKVKFQEKYFKSKIIK
jgi:inorganic pyrophosphatase